MKKIILLLLLLLCVITGHTQERTAYYPNPYTHNADDKFVLLDKSIITTQILYDRVFPFANLESFN